jgi:hypothetical protein
MTRQCPLFFGMIECGDLATIKNISALSSTVDIPIRTSLLPYASGYLGGGGGICGGVCGAICATVTERIGSRQPLVKKFMWDEMPYTVAPGLTGGNGVKDRCCSSGDGQYMFKSWPWRVTHPGSWRIHLDTKCLSDGNQTRA